MIHKRVLLRLACVQVGPLLTEASIDGAKGGKVGATRMGRTYELVVCYLSLQPDSAHVASHPQS